LTSETAQDKAQGEGAKAFYKSQRYAKSKLNMSLVAGVINIAETLVLLLNIDKLWNLAASCLSKPSPIPTSLFFISITAVLSLITALPASYYKTFVLEAKHGFNKSTVRTWANDQITTFLLTAAIGLPLVSVALWIVERYGEKFVFYIMGFLQVAFLFDFIPILMLMGVA